MNDLPSLAESFAREIDDIEAVHLDDESNRATMYEALRREKLIALSKLPAETLNGWAAVRFLWCLHQTERRMTVKPAPEWWPAVIPHRHS